MSDNFILDALRRRSRGQKTPNQVNLELTHECNLRCRHCYLEHRQSGSELMLAEWCDVIDQVVDSGCYFIAFTGGEVLCRDDFTDIVRHAQRRGIFYHFQTNGTMVDEAMADVFRGLNPTKVEVSIYGATAATHDRITGVAGSFDKSIAAIRDLRSREIRTVIKTTVLSLNWREVPQINELAQGIGAGFQPDPVVMPGVFGSGKPVDYRMSDEEFRSYMVMQGWHREADDEVSKAIRELDSPESRVICSAGDSRYAISPWGEVYPCVLWRRVCGNVRSERLVDIWSGPGMQKCRNMELELLHKCNTCDIISTCVRCAALAYLETGDELSGAPESCRMSRLLKEVKTDEESL